MSAQPTELGDLLGYLLDGSRHAQTGSVVGSLLASTFSELVPDAPRLLSADTLLGWQRVIPDRELSPVLKWFTKGSVTLLALLARQPAIGTGLQYRIYSSADAPLSHCGRFEPAQTAVICQDKAPASGNLLGQNRLDSASEVYQDATAALADLLDDAFVAQSIIVLGSISQVYLDACRTITAPARQRLFENLCLDFARPLCNFAVPPQDRTIFELTTGQEAYLDSIRHDEITMIVKANHYPFEIPYSLARNSVASCIRLSKSGKVGFDDPCISWSLVHADMSLASLQTVAEYRGRIVQQGLKTLAELVIDRTAHLIRTRVSHEIRQRSLPISIDQISLHASSDLDNARAHRFFKAIGFEQVGMGTAWIGFTNGKDREALAAFGDVLASAGIDLKPQCCIVLLLFVLVQDTCAVSSASVNLAACANALDPHAFVLSNDFNRLVRRQNRSSSAASSSEATSSTTDISLVATHQSTSTASQTLSVASSSDAPDTVSTTSPTPSPSLSSTVSSTVAPSPTVSNSVSIRISTIDGRTTVTYAATIPAAASPTTSDSDGAATTSNSTSNTVPSTSSWLIPTCIIAGLALLFMACFLVYRCVTASRFSDFDRELGGAIKWPEIQDTHVGTGPLAPFETHRIAGAGLADEDDKSMRSRFDSSKSSRIATGEAIELWHNPSGHGTGGSFKSHYSDAQGQEQRPSPQRSPSHLAKQDYVPQRIGTPSTRSSDSTQGLLAHGSTGLDSQPDRTSVDSSGTGFQTAEQSSH
ncbi:uncharacterized protein L969DRAFT_45167 [Mixia osmundae IAM 14324]|uniref:Uncharacterized protein n=1 Tax=Mixia osmundae (strain CBS 9802 / IAM 14324 / JCM 22182 / KY 12970) TaxID=764103 RepID=G7DYL9_MIXOS|nr:uncharacterized protein L969DRAFT_45167 [Mixia osmundae IAM 14324]KEI41578.1 hypothetical protein L969DRAFT_45167 [Mixia osmundae IAM 14324]GAA95679.1 hypothetical protein E5Q_02336 [Mixia osmundae IAM 14324]